MKKNLMVSDFNYYYLFKALWFFNAQKYEKNIIERICTNENITLQKMSSFSDHVPEKLPSIKILLGEYFKDIKKS